MTAFWKSVESLTLIENDYHTMYKSTFYSLKFSFEMFHTGPQIMTPKPGYVDIKLG